MRLRWILFLALAALWGCASPREHSALETYRRIERELGATAKPGAVELAVAEKTSVEVAGPVQKRQGPTPEAGSADAQSPSPSVPTLDEYLRYALLHNPGLEAAFKRWKAALERVPQVRSLPDPKLSYAYYIERVETRVGPQRHRVGLAQVFPWFGKLRLRGDVALAEAEAAYRRFESERLKLFFEVKDAYYELAYLARAVAITQENMDLAKYLEGVALSRYRVGAAQHADVIRAQVELGKLEDKLRTLRDLKEPIVAKLNAALNRPPATAVPWPRDIHTEHVEANDELILAWMRETNPELKGLEADIAKQRAAVDLAKKNYYPDITLGVDYIDTGSARIHTSDSGKDPVLAKVSINLPIWYAKYRASEREAKARLRAARRSVQNRGNALSAQVKLTLFKFRDAERKIDLYRDTLVPKARQSLRATETAYKGGKMNFLDLVDAQRVLLVFQLAYERALADRAQRLAELEMLVGRELPHTPLTPHGKPRS